LALAESMTFELQPTLTGSLIELRPLKPEDFDRLYASASDPLIWEQHPESDRWKKDVFQKFFDGAIASGGAFAVIERKTGRIIGSSRYWNLDAANSEIEVGWTFLERRFWGGRYNGEMKSLMIDHALRFVERVIFIAGEDNLRSRKALEKIGARFREKVQRPGSDGALRNNCVYVITR
jgi:RimJ/RimL family protein N-acetyltransferase